ncbi:hypothetical protein [Acinetobacter sp. ANC 4654]|uniref:hypothetical protein n=1 Tax=Acinetobacter sp. ANC 4654 TaxID=1977872 RepID=UPI00117879FC|nr:hypothetical protein [Acinetobacter sp. ANC 4654]
MDLIIRFFVWVANCFLSGKAWALGISLIGVIISLVFLKVTPVILKGAVFLYPDFGHLMCAEKNVGFNLVNYRYSLGVYHEQKAKKLYS